jgi:hypothetical protein
MCFELKVFICTMSGIIFLVYLGNFTGFPCVHCLMRARSHREDAESEHLDEMQLNRSLLRFLAAATGAVNCLTSDRIAIAANYVRASVTRYLYFIFKHSAVFSGV